MKISFYDIEVKAGFPSPSDDPVMRKLDLNDLLIKHPIATFFVKAGGDSMIGAKIYPGDILVVDRAEEVKEGKIIIAFLNGEFTVKRYVKKKRIILESANPSYPPIHINPGDDFEVWGVVTYVIHKV